jgi:hypothetical protein
VKNCPEEKDADMLVHNRFDQECEDVDGNPVKCDGWIFSSNSELHNLMYVLEAFDAYGMCLSVDSTYKVLHNGWALTTLIAETLIDSHDGNHI